MSSRLPRRVCLSLLITIFSSVLVQDLFAQQPPNVVIVITDDQGLRRSFLPRQS